jgi:hypothetical protein
MEQEKIYYSTIYTDSISLRNHLLEFLNSEDDSNKDEFIVLINYKSLGDLIDLIEHLKIFYQNYQDVQDCMCYIWEYSIDDESLKIINESITYYEEKVKLD